MKRVLGGVLLIIVVIQFFRPDRSNVPEDPAMNMQAYVKAPEDIASILVRSCNDCHSNTTRWPWYSQIAPVSWVVSDDVHSGRRHLNFSEWGTYSQKKMGKKLLQIAEVASDSSMPLTAYLLMHPEANISSFDRKKMSDWAEAEAERFLSKEDKTKENAKR